MAFTIVRKARKYRILISDVSGEIPTLAQLDANTIGFNAADNLWFLEDTSTTPATVVTANAAMTTGLVGANAVPVVRTNNPIVGANKANQNIDALDAAIGTDAQVTPLARTTGPVVVDTTVHQKIDALDAAIGVDTVPGARTNNPLVAANAVGANLTALDAAIGTSAQLTPVTRTTGQLVDNTSIQTKLDVIDALIGFDAQLSAVPQVISKNNSIYQNLDKLDTYKSVRTVKKTIGGVGVAGCDFNFATAADQNEQIIDLGAIIPALGTIISCMSHTDAVFTGAVSLAADFGTTSGGAELIASGTIYATDAIRSVAAGSSPLVTPVATAGHVFVNATPGANWASVTAGKVSVFITFIDVTNI